MSKHHFSVAERYGVFEAFGGSCYWCGEPLRFLDATVDHVIPEKYERDPHELNRIRTHFGLRHDFAINDFTNWVPAHGNCNSRKGITLFEAAPVTMAVLADVRKKAAEARHVTTKVINSKKASKIVAMLASAVEQGLVENEDLRELARILHPMLIPAGERSRHLSSRWSILRSEGDINVVTDGQRVGTITGREAADSSWQCPHCFTYGPWAGVICLNCGRKSTALD